MGHRVTQFQENHTSTEEMLSRCVNEHVSRLIYVHTHGWKEKGCLSFDDMLANLRLNDVKTCSFHLDRYWGLNIGDKREDLIGVHPFWRTDVVFTADGGNQKRFKERGINHVWLPPAICERHVFRGEFKEKYACDVAFVGAGKYHVEYPFREQLIAWLISTYGNRFKHFGWGTKFGIIREGDLNDVYASAKVVVGDSCFAGSPYYWSDRVPDTMGRGGYLIHPTTEGLDIPGMGEFKAGNLYDLHSKIEKALADDDFRTVMSGMSMNEVRSKHTYTHRMNFLLKEMGCTSSTSLTKDVI